jgi:proteic killer suppression protein
LEGEARVVSLGIANVKKIPLMPVSLRYTLMIRSFRHKGIRMFFESGSKAGIQASHAPRLRLQLARLDSAAIPEEMNLPG